MTTDRQERLPGARLLAWIVAVALFVRFVASTALVDVKLSQPTLVTVGAVLEAYEVLLAFALLPVFFLLLGWRTPTVPFRTTIAILALLGAALITWILAVLGVIVPVTTGAFLVLAVAAVAGGSILASRFIPASVEAMRPWTRTIVRVLLAAVPVVFAMRVAALEGLDPVSGSGGALRGNWFFVHLPTITLEFVVVAVFLNVVFDRRVAELRRRWYAFLPFLLVPLLIDAVTDRPLTGYVLSALVSWGSNLALFSPAVASLGLLTAVFAAFLSTLLLLGRRGKEGPWDLLLLGTASLVFAGFYPSMASVAGLCVAMLVTSLAIASWPRPLSHGSDKASSAHEESLPRSSSDADRSERNG